MIKSIVSCGCEIWNVTKEIKLPFNTFEQKILTNVRGSIIDQMAGNSN